MEAVLSQGQRGRVYRARLGERVVTVKELAFATVPDLQSIELFERECAVLRRLSHPGLPEFVDALSDGEGAQRRYLLVLGFIEGESLEARLARHTFDEAEARLVARDVLESLRYLHGLSPIVIHRDIKPANVIRRPDGTHALVDFGSVRRAGGEVEADSISGTFGFMPPEQLSREADERSDLYALGMTLLRLLTHRQPEQLLNPGLEPVFEPYVNVSSSLKSFLRRLVARSPADRFSSAAEALEALWPGRATCEAPVVVQSPGVRVTLSAPMRPLPVVEDAIPWRVRIGPHTATVTVGEAYLVGRSRDCELRVDDALDAANTVSRRHLRLEVTRAGLLVEELGSTNGTYVGTRPLPRGEAVVLRSGAELQLGNFVCEVAPVFMALGSPIERRARPPRSPAWTKPRIPGFLGGDPDGVRIVFRDDLRPARAHLD